MRTSPRIRWASRALLGILDAVLLFSLLLVPAIWLATPLKLSPFHLELPWRIAWLGLPSGLLALRVLLKGGLRRWIPDVRGLAEAALYKKICLLLVMPFAFFVAVEQMLEWSGYESFSPPAIVVGDEHAPADDSADSAGLIACPEYRWRFVPGVMWRGRRVNQLGYLDREVDPRKAPGSLRVICMGDSITAQGIPPYSGRLHERLQAAPPTAVPWEAFNMAVHGYSSVIGLRLFERRAQALNPDFVTLYYGWNDHWWGGRMPDRARLGVAMAPMRAAIYGLLKKKRFGEWLLAQMPSEREQVISREDGYLRVPPDEYAATLMRFVAEIRAAGAVPILITAPRRDRPSDMLVQRGNASSVEDIIRLHDQYVDLTRQVARESNVPLLDLAAQFDPLDKGVLMQADGIHMTRAGLDLIADLLYDKLVQITRNPEWRTADRP